jgi:uncharacterized glyoxalase superfamily protein PhnB
MPTAATRPKGAPQVMPYLYYADAAAALTFLIDAFGFTEIHTIRDDQGNVFHAQLSTGDSGVVMIGPGMTEFGTRAIAEGETATKRIFVYLDDVDAHFEHSRAAGAEVVVEPADQGPNRIHIARDCGGHEWIFAKALT